MKLAASQIAWKPEEQAAALEILRGCGFSGLEIAPTLAVGPQPYDKPAEAAALAGRVREEHGLALCSMQSIWYGQTGSLFGAERAFFLSYTKAAMRFARAAGIRNLVFGCPKNRVKPEGVRDADALPFFLELAEYAQEQGCVLGLEANPPVYGTNFLNTTGQALDMVRRIGRPGCLLNLDFGTMVINDESPLLLRGQVHSISHVHISEPELAPIRPHARHRELAAVLRDEGYTGYVSIEMKQQPPEVLARAAEYVAEVFG